MKEDTRGLLKNITDVLRTAAGSKKRPVTAAVIVAAGTGSRMNSDTPKQFLDLCGQPVVVHSLRAFNSSPYIDLIVAVVRKGDEPIYEEYRQQFGIDKLVKIIPGGNSRQDSVLCGIEALISYKDVSYVAIADGARPLTTSELVDRCVIEAQRTGASTAAFRAVDTVKISADGKVIDTTPERNTVWQATTPQVFEINLYRAAAYSAKEEGFETTDDNALCEHIGCPVSLVDCGNYNIKITRPEDMLIAEVLLKDRMKRQSRTDEADVFNNNTTQAEAPDDTHR